MNRYRDAALPPAPEGPMMSVGSASNAAQLLPPTLSVKKKIEKESAPLCRDKDDKNAYQEAGTRLPIFAGDAYAR